MELTDLLNDLERSKNIKKRIKEQLSKKIDVPAPTEWPSSVIAMTTAMSNPLPGSDLWGPVVLENRPEIRRVRK